MPSSRKEKLITAGIFLVILSLVYFFSFTPQSRFPVLLSNQTPSAKLIDDAWIGQFLNNLSLYSGHGYARDPALMALAETRFETMVSHPDIAHYGLTPNLIEEVLFPEGYSAKGYLDYLRANATAHYNLLVNAPNNVGWYIGSATAIVTDTSCPVSEATTPGVNITQLLLDHGCGVYRSKVLWLVLEFG